MTETNIVHYLICFTNIEMRDVILFVLIVAKVGRTSPLRPSAPQCQLQQMMRWMPLCTALEPIQSLRRVQPL